jgi:hypothetical protein
VSNLEQDYFEIRRQHYKRKQQIAAIVSAGFFLSSTVFAAAKFLNSTFQQPAVSHENPWKEQKN